MKRLFWLLIALLTVPNIGLAADVKITALTATTTPASTDIVPIVIDPSGTPLNRKSTVANLAKGMSAVGVVTVTQPATAATITIINNKTFTVDKSIELDGTDGTKMTFPATSATIARTDAANTFTGVQTMTSPALTTPAIAVSAAITGGTVTVSTPVLAMTQTFNEGSTVFKGITFTLTDTASAGTARFLDFLIGSNSKFYVQKSGDVYADFSGGTGGFHVGSSGTTHLIDSRLYVNGGGTLFVGSFGATNTVVVDGTVTQVSALKTTGAATGKTVVCVDVATGQLYASTSGVACAN